MCVRDEGTDRWIDENKRKKKTESEWVCSWINVLLFILQFILRYKYCLCFTGSWNDEEKLIQNFLEGGNV